MAAGMKSEFTRFRPRPCTITAARSARGTANHHPLSTIPSRLLKVTSSCVAAMELAGGSSGRRSTWVTVSATRKEIPKYAISAAAMTPTTKNGHSLRACRNTRRMYSGGVTRDSVWRWNVRPIQSNPSDPPASSGPPHQAGRSFFRRYPAETTRPNCRSARLVRPCESSLKSLPLQRRRSLHRRRSLFTGYGVVE